MKPRGTPRALKDVCRGSGLNFVARSRDKLAGRAGGVMGPITREKKPVRPAMPRYSRARREISAGR